MRIRIEQFDEWRKMFIDGKIVDAGHTMSDLLPGIYNALRHLGAELEIVRFDGYAKDPDGNEYQTEECHTPWWEQGSDDDGGL